MKFLDREDVLAFVEKVADDYDISEVAEELLKWKIEQVFDDFQSSCPTEPRLEAAKAAE